MGDSHLESAWGTMEPSLNQFMKVRLGSLMLRHAEISYNVADSSVGMTVRWWSPLRCHGLRKSTIGWFHMLKQANIGSELLTYPPVGLSSHQA